MIRALRRAKEHLVKLASPQTPRRKQDCEKGEAKRMIWEPAPAWPVTCRALGSGDMPHQDVPKGNEATVTRRDLALSDLPKPAVQCQGLPWPGC